MAATPLFPIHNQLDSFTLIFTCTDEMLVCMVINSLPLAFEGDLSLSMDKSLACRNVQNKSLEQAVSHSRIQITLDLWFELMLRLVKGMGAETNDVWYWSHPAIDYWMSGQSLVYIKQSLVTGWPIGDIHMIRVEMLPKESRQADFSKVAYNCNRRKDVLFFSSTK